METELEQLRVENERLKKTLADAKSFYGSTTWMDVRTPYNSIRGWADVTLKVNSENLTDEQRENLNMIKSSAKHLGHFLMIGIEIGRYGLLPNETQLIQINELRNHLKKSEILSSIEPNIFADAPFDFDTEKIDHAIEIDPKSFDHALKSIVHSFFDLNLSETVGASFTTDQTDLTISIRSDYDDQKGREENLGYVMGSIGWSAEKIVKLYGGDLKVTGYHESPLEILIKLPLIEMEGGTDGN